ncbi:glucose-1-phosphate cytidylyltransferase [Cyanobium sp. PCC 7001]|uniref:glucose-1-phosphate cytidylyltransferase n=1 Tax=Cyanobium sp. PCC 7001 TaxID=180281 RepID=UPI000180599E|nr:glucose-1-phosphate cytidylyltransferase [Cyanobium sp. PCC 7001]EDY39211.1 glucose-1-phosphate cytidylyltransferase [Cyanobium sp. PCC 7001]
MKAVILAGGLGTRLSEETQLRPKPMVEVGGRPILWHILKIYSSFGINDFVVCCGYKGYMIKEYFANYFLHTSDVTFHMDEGNRMEVHHQKTEPWKVTLVDTGESTQTGGRLARVRPYLGEGSFCFTYGDGLADVDVAALVRHHTGHGLQATLTAVQPPGRYGALHLEEDRVVQFQEKPDGDNAWINGGFFVLEPSVCDLIADDASVFEADVLPRLASQGQLSAFRHSGFWQPMDTLRERNRLEALWDGGRAPWKHWP